LKSIINLIVRHKILLIAIAISLAILSIDYVINNYSIFTQNNPLFIKKYIGVIKSFSIIFLLIFLGIYVKKNSIKTIKNLRYTNKNLNATLNALPGIFFEVDCNRRIMDFRTSSPEILYTTPEKFLGKKIIDVLPKDTAEIIIMALNEAINSNNPYRIEYSLEISSGHRWFDLFIEKKEISQSKKYNYICLVMDISERKQVETELIKSEKRLKDITENTLAWIWEVDTSGKYTYVSHVIEKVLGYSPDEVIGNKYFYDFFHPKDKEENKNSTLNAFKKKKPFHEFINRNVKKNGDFIWLQTSGVPILSEDGKLLGYRGADIDITKRKQMEEKLKKINKELSNYTNIVSHDLKSPLIAVGGGIQVLLNKYSQKLDEKATYYLNGIHSSLINMDKLITDLLQLSRIGKVIGKKTDINAINILEEVKIELRTQLKESKIKLIIKEPLPKLWVDKERIKQVFNNLIGNAIKFMGNQKNPEIEIGISDENKEENRFYIKDNGIGIDKNNTAKIFNAFHRLNDIKSEGSGLGLTIIKRIIENHDGKISLESEKGMGSTFYFTIPKK
jgi:PAS domain S-box-containing protein